MKTDAVPTHDAPAEAHAERPEAPTKRGMGSVPCPDHGKNRSHGRARQVPTAPLTKREKAVPARDGLPTRARYLRMPRAPMMLRYFSRFLAFK